MTIRTPEQRHLLEQVQQIAEGLGRSLAPFCEVIVNDLLDADRAVVAIHNNLSGRAVGDPATELGLARIADPATPQVLANYPNRFPDGRPCKGTSVGIRDSHGNYVAALCLNMDLTPVHAAQALLAQFGRTDDSVPVAESLAPAGAAAIRQHIDAFAARHGTTARALKAEARRTLLRELKEAGLTDMRRAMETVAAHLGVSRATVYKDFNFGGTA
jgi:predicted transcriptional regulator YheO